MLPGLAASHLVLTGVVVGTYVWARGRGSLSSSTFFAGAIAAAALYGVTAAAVFVTPQELQLVLFPVRDTFKSGVVCFWLVFVIHRTGHAHRLTRRRWAVLAGGAAVTVGLLVTNPVHGLAYTGVGVANGAFYPLRGPLFWVAFAGMHLAYLASVALLLIALFTTQYVQPRTAVGIVIGLFLLFPFDLVNLLAIEPRLGVSLMPAATLLVGAATAMVLGSFDLLDVALVARNEVLDATDDAVVVVRDGVVVDFNEAARPFLSVEEPIGRSVTESLREQVRSVLPVEAVADGNAADVPRSDGSADSGEIAIEVGGRRRYYDPEITAAPGMSGVVVFFRDVTALKRQERELERKNERLETFTGTVAHDLRNPLSVAQGYVPMAREGRDDAHERVAESLDRMEAMITDLLELARQGQMVGETEAVDLAGAAREAWSVVDAPAAELVVEADGTVEADEERLDALLENLFRNAVEHGGEEVTVRVGELSEGFYVADDGPGIPAEKREEVFEHGHTTNEEGTGFGLSIVSEIASAHGWEVEAAESESGGARFEVTAADSDAELEVAEATG